MKPILFDTNMVRAILAGKKTVTRRMVKLQPEKSAHSPYKCFGGRFAFRIGKRGCTDQYKPPYRPGDILYVRETWAHPSEAEIAAGASPDMYLYKADELQPAAWDKWRPSIHMPSEAARLFLRVTDVRVERLQDITEEQAKAEGLYKGWSLTERSTPSTTAKQAFMWVWGMSIKPADRARYGWAANPWVWVIEFERCGKPEEREG